MSMRVKRHIRLSEKLYFMCPACQDYHVISDRPGSWTFNGDYERPTFTPSVLVTGHQIERDKAGNWTGEWLRGADGKPLPSVCHSFVTDGQIRFLGDCTHALANMTVPLPEYED